MKGTRRNRSAQVLISCKHRGDKCWRDEMWTVTQAPLSVPMTLKMCVWEYVGISITSALKLVSFKSSLNIALPFHVCTTWVMQSAHTYGTGHKPVTYNTVFFSQWSAVYFPQEMVSRFNWAEDLLSCPKLLSYKCFKSRIIKPVTKHCIQCNKVQNKLRQGKENTSDDSKISHQLKVAWVEPVWIKINISWSRADGSICSLVCWMASE